MTDKISLFFDAWGMADSDRMQALQDAAHPDLIYTDPNTAEPVVGLGAMDQYLAMFIQHMPGSAAKAVSVDTHFNYARVTVDFLMKGAATMRGQYFAELDDDGRISRMVGFIGTGDPA